MEFKPVSHVIFDLDGLLLDSEPVYCEAYRKIAARYGKEYTNDLKLKVMGSTFVDSSNIIVDGLKLPITSDVFMKQCEKLLDVLLPDLSLMPDDDLHSPCVEYLCPATDGEMLNMTMMTVIIYRYISVILFAIYLYKYWAFGRSAKKLIEHLHANKVPMALATATVVDAYHKKIDKNYTELFSLLRHKTLGTSDPLVKKGKPWPDIFLVTAEKFEEKPKPEQCLVFEDSVNGVKAARAAGMQVVMIPSKDMDWSKTKEATLVLNSLEEFRPEVFGLPGYD